MRLKETVAEIDYNETKQFFERRATKFSEKNPYSVTMYQDNNPELVQSRNRKEVEKLYPLLRLDKMSRVLDIACGIGRWADAIDTEIDEYCGVDFGKELIAIANERNLRPNFSFIEGSVNEIEQVLKNNHKQEKYNKIIMIGILMYINDKDLEAFFEQVERICDAHTMICIREPIGLEARLTLKDFYSAELKDNYNAIYRTRAELEDVFEKTFMAKGFRITRSNFLFEEDVQLNNRKETAQYYYILER